MINFIFYCNFELIICQIDEPNNCRINDKKKMINIIVFKEVMIGYFLYGSFFQTLF